MDQATEVAVGEVVAGIRRRANDGLRQLLHQIGQEAAASVQVAKPADVTVRAVSDDEVVAALGLAVHAPIDLWVTARLGAQADALPVACKAVVAAAAASGREVADKLERANAALTEGAVDKVIDTARAFGWDKVRSDFTKFMEMFQNSVKMNSPQMTEYHDWPQLSARWQEVNRILTETEWDAVSTDVVADLLPPAGRALVVAAVAEGRRRVQRTLAATQMKLIGHSDHLSRFDALYAQEVLAIRSQAKEDTRRLMNTLIPDQVKVVHETLARMWAERQKKVRDYLRGVDFKFALRWGAVIGLGVVGVLVGIAYLISLFGSDGQNDWWKLLFSLVSAAALWVFKEKVLKPYERENYSPVGGYSEVVVNKCRALVRDAFTPPRDPGQSVANNSTTHIRRQMIDQRQRLLKSAFVTEYERAYAECITLFETLSECHARRAAELPQHGRELLGLLTFAADPTETIGIHMNRLIAGSVRLVTDIADDWENTRQEFDALRRWSPTKG